MIPTRYILFLAVFFFLSVTCVEEWELVVAPKPKRKLTVRGHIIKRIFQVRACVLALHVDSCARRDSTEFEIVDKMLEDHFGDIDILEAGQAMHVLMVTNTLPMLSNPPKVSAVRLDVYP